VVDASPVVLAKFPLPKPWNDIVAGLFCVVIWPCWNEHQNSNSKCLFHDLKYLKRTNLLEHVLSCIHIYIYILYSYLKLDYWKISKIHQNNRICFPIDICLGWVSPWHSTRWGNWIHKYHCCGGLRNGNGVRIVGSARSWSVVLDQGSNTGYDRCQVLWDTNSVVCQKLLGGHFYITSFKHVWNVAVSNVGVQTACGLRFSNEFWQRCPVALASVTESCHGSQHSRSHGHRRRPGRPLAAARFAQPFLRRGPLGQMWFCHNSLV
jgi:hypothetical protein